ncbi:DNA/RNA non-specific endonuclease [Streptomyces sp. NPDC093586]|uniref:DNA/RNA non-specific endonuclease n=1 Tax=Streptomyces sp. NPDC093586 TaxID=3366042 RepID=UPI0037FD35D1
MAEHPNPRRPLGRRRHHKNRGHRDPLRCGGYSRAHLLAAMIGGSNKDPRNFFTMHSYANSPVMRKIEMHVRNAVRDGETIEYSVTPSTRTTMPRSLLG